jgi:hypothetical protein
LAATELNPADFPLGSPQSRAIARALLQGRRPPQLSQHDEDALLLHAGAVHLGGASPGSPELEVTTPFARGGELHQRKFGPVVAAHLDEHLKRLTQASSAFERLFGREPERGDVLSYEHIAVLHSPEFNAERFLPFIAAWQRQLPELVCPLRFEEGSLLKRVIEGQGHVWQEETDIQPQGVWRQIEHECRWHELGMPVRMASDPPIETMPTILAFVFLGVARGQAGPLGFAEPKHTCRPCTKKELRQANVIVTRDAARNETVIGFTRLPSAA